MYVILINDDNTFSATKKQRIVQRSKLVDTFWFLVKPDYNGHDMSTSTVLLEYLKPESKEYKTEILVLSDDMYKDHLKYVLPIDTEFTKEAGTISLQLSFVYVDIDADGNPIQRVRKIAPAIRVKIVAIEAWSDIIPDDALNVIDQKIIEVDSRIKALNDMNEIMDNTKADNLSYEDNKLQLLANGEKIGDAITIAPCDEDHDEDGVPVVDFNKTNGSNPEGSVDIVDNVVDF